MLLWIAALGFMSAVVAILIAVGERGEKRELVKSRDRAWRERDDARVLVKYLDGEKVRLERLLSRELMREENSRMVDEAESIPVSYEERAG